MATDPARRNPPSRNQRLAFAAVVGLVSAAWAIAVGKANPEFVSDFDQVWAGSRAVLDGLDPYAVVGPGMDFPWKWPLYYPLPALLSVAPLALMPVLLARAVFAGLGAALLAWGVTRDNWQRLPIFLSVSFMVTVELGQWSSWFAAAFFIPAVAVMGAAKPNLGVAVAAGDRSGRSMLWMLGGAVILLAVSQLIQPMWHEPWLRSIREAPHFRPPVLRPFGFLLLAAALRWRRPEARWLLALSVVPLPPSFYDQLMLAVACLTFRESLAFAASTVLLFFYVGFNTPQPDYLSWGRLVGNATVWFCYLPVLAFVLRRPNEWPSSGGWTLPGWLGRFRRENAAAGGTAA